METVVLQASLESYLASCKIHPQKPTWEAAGQHLEAVGEALGLVSNPCLHSWPYCQPQRCQARCGEHARTGECTGRSMAGLMQMPQNACHKLQGHSSAQLALSRPVLVLAACENCLQLCGQCACSQHDMPRRALETKLLPDQRPVLLEL